MFSFPRIPTNPLRSEATDASLMSSQLGLSLPRPSCDKLNQILRLLSSVSTNPLDIEHYSPAFAFLPAASPSALRSLQMPHRRNCFLKGSQRPLAVERKCLCFLGVCTVRTHLFREMFLPDQADVTVVSCFHSASRPLVFPCRPGKSQAASSHAVARTDRISEAFPVSCVSTPFLFPKPGVSVCKHI